MKTAAPHLQRARMAALDLAEAADVPEWVHLLPTEKGAVQTQDARGPYHVADADAIIAASFADQTRLQIDENHSEDLRAGRGEPSPARGWITEMQARADGIWGRVEWTAAGRALVADKAYRAMSPVILHDAGKKIASILRASLVNRPNFRGLATLNQETSMNGMDQIAAACGLAADASADAIVTAIKAMKGKDATPALQSALAAIGVALGIEGDAKPEAIVAGVQALQAAQATNVTQAARIAALETSHKRNAAETFMAAQIAAKRGIPLDKREGLIALHMQDAAQAEAVAKLYPDLGTAQIATARTHDAATLVTSLNAGHLAAATALGIAPEAYLKTLAAEQKERA